MNIVFLTLSNVANINDRGIYNDLLRKFRNEGHNVYVIKPFERRTKRNTELYESDGVSILGVKTLNIQKTSVIEKGLGTVLLEYQYIKAIKTHLKSIVFDLILFSTPPITLVGAIKYLKRINPKAITYLLLKDIFPQNAVDIEMLSPNGLLYKYFRKKEIDLYNTSNYIGCMSPANVNFIIKHNSFLNPDSVEVAPNSIELGENEVCYDKKVIRENYGLPIDKPIFIYGGNLGKPQGIDFLVKCLEANANRDDCFFVIVGNGTERHKIENWCNTHTHNNIKLLSALPKTDYDLLVQSCDIGLIFLDHRFLIPNYPSRLLSYLENKMPIIAATDPNCDMGQIAESNGYGYYCESNNVDSFTECVNKYVQNIDCIKSMGMNGFDFLKKNYLVENTYNAIVKHMK